MKRTHPSGQLRRGPVAVGPRLPGLAAVRRAAPIVLYQQPGIHVTSEAITVAGRRFPISELTQLGTARGPRDWLPIRVMLVTGALLAAVGTALGYTGGLYRLSASGYFMLGLAAFVPMLVALLRRRLRPSTYQLWGCYQGSMILLFSCVEARQFGQVSRAVLRAGEAVRPDRSAYPLALVNPRGSIS